MHLRCKSTAFFPDIQEKKGKSGESPISRNKKIALMPNWHIIRFQAIPAYGMYQHSSFLSSSTRHLVALSLAISVF